MAIAEKELTTQSIEASGLSLVELRSATKDEWNDILARAPGGGHAYQSYEWGEFKRQRKWKPVRLVMKRGNEIYGAAQFLVLSTPTPGTLMYAPKGPWLPWDDQEAVRYFFKGVQTVAARENAHTIKIEPEVLASNTGVTTLLTDFGFHKGRYDLQYKTTMVVDLSPSEENILARMKHKTRYNIRLAKRKGVKVVEDNSSDAQRYMLDLMRITAARDGFQGRDENYHMAQWQAMLEAGSAHFFFATHDGQRLAGLMALTFGKKYWYVTGASGNEKRNLMPAYLLQWEVMRWAKQQGITYYDMVAIPNPDNLNESDPMWGLYRFKSGFGGEITEFIGCYDLPVKRIRASLWYNFEPIYYRIYRKLFNNTYY